MYIALNCEDFEGQISAYIEGELGGEEEKQLEQHILICAECSETLNGVQQLRLALYGLGQCTPSANFKLKLSNSIQQSISPATKGYRLALSLALGVILAILLWPEPQENWSDYQALETQDSGPARMVPAVRRDLNNVWGAHFSQLPNPNTHSHARVLTVSF